MNETPEGSAKFKIGDILFIEPFSASFKSYNGKGWYIILLLEDAKFEKRFGRSCFFSESVLYLNSRSGIYDGSLNSYMTDPEHYSIQKIN